MLSTHQNSVKWLIWGTQTPLPAHSSYGTESTSPATCQRSPPSPPHISPGSCESTGKKVLRNKQASVNRIRFTFTKLQPILRAQIFILIREGDKKGVLYKKFLILGRDLLLNSKRCHTKYGWFNKREDYQKWLEYKWFLSYSFIQLRLYSRQCGSYGKKNKTSTLRMIMALN